MFVPKNIWVFPKIRGIYPKMDGLFHGSNPMKMDDLGGKLPLFLIQPPYVPSELFEKGNSRNSHRTLVVTVNLSRTEIHRNDRNPLVGF